jgi:hypothetical protein
LFLLFLFLSLFLPLPLSVSSSVYPPLLPVQNFKICKIRDFMWTKPTVEATQQTVGSHYSKAYDVPSKINPKTG